METAFDTTTSKSASICAKDLRDLREIFPQIARIENRRLAQMCWDACIQDL